MHLVIDTNVLIETPAVLTEYPDTYLAVPIKVLEELDNLKTEKSERGYGAREAVRNLVREYERLDSKLVFIDNTIEQSTPDAAIIAAAREWQIKINKPVILLTNDLAMRLRALAFGIKTLSHTASNIKNETAYTGCTELHVSSDEIDQVHNGGLVVAQPIPDNSFIKLTCYTNKDHCSIGRYNAKNSTIRPVTTPSVWGIRARNLEQHYALDLLLDDRIQLVTLEGKAGTGKTLLAVAAGLSRVVDAGTYTKLLVARPIMPLGRDLGYLPGTIEEKLDPWMQPIHDNIEFLCTTKAGKTAQELVDFGYLQVEPLTYIRGRSIPKQYMIVDEAQNLTTHEIKTIITRAGEGTKIVFTGDPEQIDNPKLSYATCGLSVLVDKFKGQSLYGHVKLVKGERSKLAELATKLL